MSAQRKAVYLERMVFEGFQGVWVVYRVTGRYRLSKAASQKPRAESRFLSVPFGRVRRLSA